MDFGNNTYISNTDITSTHSGTIRILLLYIDSSFFRHHLIRISILLVIGLTTTKVFTNSGYHIPLMDSTSIHGWN